jgi:hypothetical protein
MTVESLSVFDWRHSGGVAVERQIGVTPIGSAVGLPVVCGRKGGAPQLNDAVGTHCCVAT